MAHVYLRMAIEVIIAIYQRMVIEVVIVTLTDGHTIVIAILTDGHRRDHSHTNGWP